MNYKECARLLSERDNILLVTHKNPDGDTMGSAAALCSALQRKGKTAWLYPNDAVIKKLLPYVEMYFAPAEKSAPELPWSISNCHSPLRFCQFSRCIIG